MSYSEICEIVLRKKCQLDKIDVGTKYVYLGKEEFEIIKEALGIPEYYINTPLVDRFFGLGLCVVNIKSFISVGI
jgi:hypothetical protein